jgi:PTH1 family peptidyl-tRNA hydrolase
VRAILGIGNKGSRYQNTRHNIGFLLLDHFALKHKLLFKASSGSYNVAEGHLNSNEFILIKPATYINSSGIAAAELFDVYDLNLYDLLVVQDDLNLEFGSLRIRASGGDGGHNGVSSIIYHLNTNQFPRLRFGLGNSFEKGNMADFVLSQLSDSETEILNRSTELINKLLEEFIIGGLKNMLNLYSKLYNSDSQNHLLNQSGD